MHWIWIVLILSNTISILGLCVLFAYTNKMIAFHEEELRQLRRTVWKDQPHIISYFGG